MSGLVKGIKKVFKKVGEFVKKYWKYIVIAVAVYFTAGVALSYFGGTAGFASAMPGFGAGGIFSKAAVWMGFNGSASVASGLSITSGAFSAGVSSAGYGAMSKAALKGLYGLTPEAATAASQAAITGTGVTTAGAVGPAGSVTTNAAGKVVASTGPAAAGPAAAPAAQTAAGAATKALAGAMKMQAASTLLQTAGGLFSESESDIIENKHNMEWGQAFGVGRDGSRQYGWATGEAPPAGPAGGGSQFAPQQQNSSQQGGSMFAAQGGGDSFLQAPQATGTTAPQAPQGDFIVQPQPAGGMV